MRAYVAASSREIPRARAAMDALRAAGVRITHDWIPSVEAAFAAGITEAKADDARAYEAASADMRGVVTADVLVFLAPTDTSKMAWSELGAALALGIPCVVAHDDEERRKQSIVTRLAGVHCADADIVDAVRAIAECDPFARHMRSVAWYVGRTIEHATKLRDARSPDRERALREQIAADLRLAAGEVFDATHAFFGRAA